MAKIYVNQDNLMFVMRTGIHFATYSASVFRMEYKKPNDSIGWWPCTATASAVIDGSVVTFNSASGVVVWRATSTSQIDAFGDWRFQPYIGFQDASHARGETFTIHVYQRFA